MQKLLTQDDHPFDFIQVKLGEAAGRDHLSTRLQEIATAGKVAVLVDPQTTEEDAVPMLVPAITRRIHFIRASGPLHDAAGVPLSYYRVKSPVPLLAEDQALATFAAKITEFAEGLHVSIASPLELLAELFTIKGAGCLVRRGAHMLHFTEVSDLDEARFVRLLENSFRCALVSRAFFDEATSVFVDDEYRCGAVLVPHQRSMYLSKFAVHQDARGEGLAQELWQHVIALHPALCWRSRIRNPFNQWYDKKSDGVHTEGDWRVYWRGISRTDIPAVIDSCLHRPLDFASGADEKSMST
jgi:acetylglutamate synthase